MPQEAPRVFEDIPVIGALPPADQSTKLELMNEPDLAAEIGGDAQEETLESFLEGWGKPRPWQYTTHQIGYIAPRTPGGSEPGLIVPAATIAPDASLQGGRINIRLSRLRILEYPGSGLHQVLFTFKAENQVPGAAEPVSFSQTYRVQQGQLAGIAGYPIFLGLTVGANGVAFQCSTVNVKNDNDQTVLGFLDSPAFQGGLNLLTTAQPVLKPFAGITLDLAKMIARRHENVLVQDFYLGLDFSDDLLGVRLALGNYVAVQVPDEAAINWREWVFDPESGAVVRIDDRKQSLPYNYVAFAVNRYASS